MNILTTLTNYFRCAQSGLVVSSTEPDIIFKALQDHVCAQSLQDPENTWQLHFWDVVDNLTNASGIPIMADVNTGPQLLPGLKPTGGGAQVQRVAISLPAALMDHLNLARERTAAAQKAEAEGEILDPIYEQYAILVIKNADRLLLPEGPLSQNVDKFLLQLLQKITIYGPGSYVYVILQVIPGFEIPKELENYFTLVEHKLPDDQERREYIASAIVGMEEENITDKVIESTAGLSRTKTLQFVSETLSEKSFLCPKTIFAKKAKHLSASSKLDVWSPEFNSQVPLSPVPKLKKYANAIEIKILVEENSFTNSELEEGQIRVKIGYLDKSNRKHIEEWLQPMAPDEFEALFRPDRNFFSFKSVMGLTGLKQFFINSLRDGIPNRAKLKHVMLVGVPGTGKSHIMRCVAGEFGLPLSSFKAANLHSKWVGESDKNLVNILETAGNIGGLFAFDEFQRLLPQGGSDEAGGTENRLLGELLTWLNDQDTNLVISAANNISKLPDEVTRSGRVDALFYVGFPDQASRKDAWGMYLRKHDLDTEQKLPEDNYWVPADIMSCCRLAEQQGVSVVEASKWITPSYKKSPEQMDALMRWAESVGCICATTGQKYVQVQESVVTATKVVKRTITKAKQ
jgi:hypothetical protein